MSTSVRHPSNSLILTNVSLEILEDPRPLIIDLAQGHKYCIELVALSKFGRIILICESNSDATEVMAVLKRSSRWSQLNITYSMRDNEYGNAAMNSIKINNSSSRFAPLAEQDNGPVMDYLPLPLESESKRFLISPPLSPPPDWDHWDRVEEGPNTTAIYSPQDLSHLLWEKLGGTESSMVRKYQEADLDAKIETEQFDIKATPEVLFEGLNLGVPAIIIDPSKVVPFQNNQPKPIPKTAIPPVNE